MSRATQWAASIAAKDREIADAEAAKPEGLAIGGGTGEVTREGGLHLDKELTLTADEVPRLIDWLNLTFK